MKLSDIARLRLVSQQLARQKFKKPAQLVAWMGAMQAQDPEMAKWAVGTRLPRATVRTVETAIDTGEILRTHLMRPTWHLVAAQDIRWMLMLTAPQIKNSIGARHRQLGLTTATIAKSRSVIEKTLSDGRPRSRVDLVAALQKAGFGSEDNRMAHLLMLAELEGMICSGPSQEGKVTYDLLDIRAPKPNRMNREESLAELASRYLTSHGPATARDFAWWSGLKAADVRAAFGLVNEAFASSIVDGKTYWYSRTLRAPVREENNVQLLPAYDEFTISYADRGASIVDRHRSKAMSSNGIFRPLVIVGGVVVGTWRRARAQKVVKVEVGLFKAPSQALKRSIEVEAVRYGQFLGEELDVSFSKGGSS